MDIIECFLLTLTRSYHQYNIQGTFEAGIPVWKPKKSSSTLPKSFFFIKQTSSFLLCEIYWKLDILNAYLWIKYSLA